VIQEVSEYGYTFRLYSGEEAHHFPQPECLHSLRGRLFTLPRPDEDVGWFLDLNTHVFLDGRWDFMLLHSPGPIPDNFPDDEESLLTSERYGTVEMDYPWQLEAICATLRNRGCEEIFIAWLDEYPTEYIGTRPYLEQFFIAQYNIGEMPFSFERPAFDATGTWGYYTDAEDMIMIGGEPDFIAEVADRHGGMEAYRAKADTYWSIVVEHSERDPDRERGIDPYLRMRACVRRWYRMCRWDNCPV